MSIHRESAHARLGAFSAFLYACLGLLGLRLLQTQLVQNVYYASAAERNRTQIIRQTAPRGRIYDRDGAILAANQAVFSLIYLPPKDRDPRALSSMARDLATRLGENPAALLDALRRAIREESAMRLAEKLPSKTMFKLSELRTLYPGINLIVEARRYYTRGAFAAHLLGYLGRMDEASWRRLKGQGYRADSWIGKAGVEKLLEGDLRGTDGGLRMEVDARGRLKRVLERIPWQPGSDIRLSIDAGVQSAAEEALRRSISGRGAAVVMDAQDGRVLALASIPDFDPNEIIAPLDRAGSAQRQIPEFNLALHGSYPPGSIFKIVTGAALLNDGAVSPQETTYCPGYFELGRRVILCWEPKGHRFQSWLGAVAHSCDVYFYKMGLRVGGAAIERYARMFRIGERSMLGLPGESAGKAFGPSLRPARGWRDGDTVNLSIGQGGLLVTPIQMAVVVAAVANRGTLWRPRIIDAVEYHDGRAPYRSAPEVLARVDLKSSTWDLLQQALEDVVRDGTGRGVQLPGLVTGGKTGTAENPSGKDHSWFVAYAHPAQEPSRTVALAVLVQHGGHGSVAAVPVARAILQAAFPAPGSGMPPRTWRKEDGLPQAPRTLPVGLPAGGPR